MTRRLDHTRHFDRSNALQASPNACGKKRGNLTADEKRGVNLYLELVARDDAGKSKITLPYVAFLDKGKRA